MSRKNRQTPVEDKLLYFPIPVYLTGILFFLIEIAVLPGAFSPFRQPKMGTAVIGLGLLVGGSLSFDLLRGKLKLPKDPLIGVLLVLPVFQALSALWSPSPNLALRTSAISALWILAIFWIATWSAGARNVVLKWTVAGVVVSGLVLFLQLTGTTPFSLPTFDQQDRLRLTGLCGNPSDLAMAGILLLPLLLLPVLKDHRRLQVWILPIFITVTAVFTEGLTAIATILLVGAGLLVHLRSRRVFIGATAIAVAIVLIVAANGSIRSRLDKQFDRLGRQDWYGLLSARSDGWTAAATMVRNSPFVGVGAGQFSREFYPARRAWVEKNHSLGSRAEYPTHFAWTHNDPLQLISELGLLGLAWMIALGLSLYRLRSRHRRLLIFSVLSWLLFLLLHYPTHLAVGLVPATLFLAEILQFCPRLEIVIQRRFLSGVAAVGVAAAAGWIAFNEVAQIRLNLWHGVAEGALKATESASEIRRRQMLEAVERQSIVQIIEHPGEAHWIWRLVGRTNLLENSYQEAEVAFRRAGALFPHEEAEMGLGLALAGQGRMTEAIYHLNRACRLNPKLVDLIQHPELRKAVRSRLNVRNP
ncbi:MAG: O-antigen ligase family protein [Thermoanaerobaculales bacterium]|nr:O-antigen ligase family protein [Thermoanaerobaculales bacterium]